MTSTSAGAMRAQGTSLARKTPAPKGAKVCTSRYFSRAECVRVAMGWSSARDVAVSNTISTLDDHDAVLNKGDSKASVGENHSWRMYVVLLVVGA